MDNVCQIKATPRFVLILSALAVALTSAALVGPSAAAEPIADRDAICRVPFEKLKDPKTGEYFPLSSAINENAKLPDSVRQRYIVSDFNSTDESGSAAGTHYVDGRAQRLHRLNIASHKTDLAGWQKKPRFTARLQSVALTTSQRSRSV